MSRTTLRVALLLLAAAVLAGCAGANEAPNPGPAYLAANAKAPGVITLPNGLEYKVLQLGPPGGVSPTASDQVQVNYEGRLLDGQVFDTNKDGPATFTVGELIPAWTQALQLMHPGDVWMLYAPADLAYGPSGAGPIPPNSVLVFKIELVAVLPTGAAAGHP